MIDGWVGFSQCNFLQTLKMIGFLEASAGKFVSANISRTPCHDPSLDCAKRAPPFSKRQAATRRGRTRGGMAMLPKLFCYETQKSRKAEKATRTRGPSLIDGWVGRVWRCIFWESPPKNKNKNQKKNNFYFFIRTFGGEGQIIIASTDRITET